MSIDGYVQTIEDLATEVLFATGALRSCPAHGTTIRVGDEDAERHAYAKGTVMVNSSGRSWMLEDLRPAIADHLDLAADDDECPTCAKVMAE